MSDTHIANNERSRERLRALVARLSPDELARPVDGGWTVKALLAHLAFWDRYARTVLVWWQAEGFKPLASVANIVNAAALESWKQLPDSFVIADVVAAAEAMDAAIAALPAALVQAITDAGAFRFTDRSVHRTEHVEGIERALAR